VPKSFGRIVAKAGILFLLQVVLLPGLAVAQEPGPTEIPELELTAQSAVLMDGMTGRIIYAKNPDERRAPASMTKIMTLLLGFEAIRAGKADLEDMVVASRRAKELGGSTIFLDADEEMSLEDIIKGIAISSGNDASLALAEHIAGSEEKFVEMMNARAKELGMKNTQFMNSHGLDEDGHYTSARDLAILGRYITQEYPEILEYTKIYDGGFLRKGTPAEFRLWNTNKLVRFYQGVDGLKTGSTARAGSCVTATAKRGETRFIAVVMGAPSSKDHRADATKLLDYGFANYVSVLVAERGQVVVPEVRVFKGQKENLDLVAADRFGVTVAKGKEDALKKKLTVQEVITAPVRKGQVLGSLEIQDSETSQALGKVDLVASEGIERAGLLTLFWRMVNRMFPF